MSTVMPSSDRARRRLAWAAPAVVAGVVAGAVALSSANASGASPNLPPRTAAQLLVDVQTSTATAFSGEVSETANLGLPALPGGHDSASLSWQTFLTGTHSARVWADGPDRQRLALVGELSEADVVHNGQDLWTYTSQTNTVTHTTLTPHTGRSDTASTGPDATAEPDPTPAAVAARVLKAVSPSTAVTVDTAEQVAGRDAYTLVLTPRDAQSTVRRVTIAIDATKHIPLRVQVFGAAATPALSSGFTSISFTRPAASVFAFTAPKGATVSTDPLGVRSTHGYGRHHHGSGSTAGSTADRPAGTRTAGDAKPTVIGSGWTAVVELPRGSAGALGSSQLNELTTKVGSSGERLLHTALLNAVLLPDGRVFVGAVTPALLEHVAATTPR